MSIESSKGINIGIILVIVIASIGFVLLSPLSFSQYLDGENTLQILTPIKTIGEGLGQAQSTIENAIEQAGPKLETAIEQAKQTVEKGPSKSLTPEYDASTIEQMIHKLTNEQRVLHGLGTLRLYTEISGIAREHSLDMATRDYFAHVSPEGLDSTGRAKQAKYSCTKTVRNFIYSGIAENIFQNNLYDSVQLIGDVPVSYDWNSMKEIAKSTVDGWMDSERHRKNILTPRFDREGIGVVISPDDKVYITQNLC